MKKLYSSIVILLMAIGLNGCAASFPETPAEQKAFLEAEGEQVATFVVDKKDPTRLHMKGVIYGNTLKDIQQVLDQNPQVKTLVMEEVPGSVDDEVNLLASREIRQRHIATYIPKNGWVASGGTDMFLAGASRAVHEKARLGVHSWAGGEEEAIDLPRDHPEHQKYLQYYREMQIPVAFYWYTLKAASPENMHWMTSKEIRKYKVLTGE